MRILLPPSETKRSGGSASALDLSALAEPRLTAQRSELLSAVRTLASDTESCIRTLKLGPQQHGEVERNRALLHSPTMPALSRYTGVLYDAIAADELTGSEHAFASKHVYMHSALWGIISAGDPIPAYRLSYNSAVPALGKPLKRFWRSAASEVLDDWTGLVLDLRSRGYADLGPLTSRPGVVSVDVVTRGEDGSLRALNHFNKKGKGELVGSLIRAGHSHTTIADLVDDLRDRNYDITILDQSRLQLIVASSQRVSSK